MEIIDALQEMLNRYGENGVAVFARKKGLRGYAWENGAKSFSAEANEIPLFKEEECLEIRLMGGVQREFVTHSVHALQQVLESPCSSSRMFLIPSYFPWESFTDLPMVVREPLEEKFFRLPAPSVNALGCGGSGLRFCENEAERIEDAIQAIMKKMRDGQCYLMNYTTRVPVALGAERTFSASTFLHAWLNEPTRFGGFIKIENTNCGAMIFSPERFVAIRDGHVVTEPIKGTAVAKNGAAPTFADAQKLWNTEKEICEHTMVVDLLRNDLNGVCEPGSVKVWRAFFAGIAGNLLQMQSTLGGTLRENQNAGSVLGSMLPGGSVTGTPKWRVCELTQVLEPHRRGYYTGVFGVAEPGGNMDSALLIRSLFLENGALSAGVGAGITTLSSPKSEVREFEVKWNAFARRLS